MKDMQPGIVLFRQFYGFFRAFQTCGGTSYVLMLFRRYFSPVFFDCLVQVGRNNAVVFAMDSKKGRAVSENVFDGIAVFNSQVPRAGPHEKLHSANILRIHTLDLLEVILTGSKVEGIICI